MSLTPVGTGEGFLFVDGQSTETYGQGNLRTVNYCPQILHVFDVFNFRSTRASYLGQYFLAQADSGLRMLG